ncbi:MAG: hypothetical protein A2096_01230, partial [Spirochaetes bacterium GWF1_41_5]
MFKSRLKKYAFINAKLRGRISRILSFEDLNNMAQSRSAGETLQQLARLGYENLQTVFEQTGDLKSVELELSSAEINIFTGIEKHLEHEVLFFYRLLIDRYEAAIIKNILRLWFFHHVRGFDISSERPYLYRKDIHCKIPADQMLTAKTLEEFAGLLAESPWGKAVQAGIKNTTDNKSIFYIELELDRLYYQRLLNGAGRLDTPDYKIAEKLVKCELNLENISALIRYKTIYNLPAEQAASCLINFQAAGSETVAKLYSGSSAEIMRKLLDKKYASLLVMISGSGQDSSPLMVDRLLYFILVQEVKKILCSYPFTIGIILAWFILKRQEIKNIRSILNARM